MDQRVLAADGSQTNLDRLQGSHLRLQMHFLPAAPPAESFTPPLVRLTPRRCRPRPGGTGPAANPALQEGLRLYRHPPKKWGVLSQAAKPAQCPIAGAVTRGTLRHRGGGAAGQWSRGYLLSIPCPQAVLQVTNPPFVPPRCPGQPPPTAPPKPRWEELGGAGRGSAGIC